MDLFCTEIRLDHSRSIYVGTSLALVKMAPYADSHVKTNTFQSHIFWFEPIVFEFICA